MAFQYSYNWIWLLNKICKALRGSALHTSMMTSFHTALSLSQNTVQVHGSSYSFLSTLRSLPLQGYFRLLFSLCICYSAFPRYSDGWYLLVQISIPMPHFRKATLQPIQNRASSYTHRCIISIHLSYFVFFITFIVWAFITSFVL